MHIRSIFKHISLETEQFNKEFELAKKSQENAQLYNNNSYLDRKNMIVKGKDKLRNKWQ
ncbi:hypothetical protein [uncultured Tyzzerella sp.]|uniref:hypothetical protein n=1 Tax=uncultured Tyzzerella sp. TaxID=2321398 RepID=UPI002943752D|nr:hypothetical protein [uncultured Tyzzerella sp.]